MCIHTCPYIHVHTYMSIHISMIELEVFVFICLSQPLTFCSVKQHSGINLVQVCVKLSPKKMVLWFATQSLSQSHKDQPRENIRGLVHGVDFARLPQIQQRFFQAISVLRTLQLDHLSQLKTLKWLDPMQKSFWPSTSM